jgi:hypothetical protein
MQIVPHGSVSGDAVGYGGLSSVRNSGYTVTDSAGQVAPGTVSPSLRSNSGGGGIDAYWDFSHLLSGNQRLKLGGFVDYGSMQTTVGPAPGGAVNTANIDRNRFTMGAEVGYSVNSFFLTGVASVYTGDGRLTDNTTGGQGSFDTKGYSFDVSAGNAFTLFNSLTYSNPSLATKAPARASGGYQIKLNLSGHAGYYSIQDDGFTDSAGFSYGAEHVKYGDMGGRASVSWFIPSGNVAWMPYVGATVDRQLGFTHTLDIPAQGGNAADVINFGQDTTYWGGELGLNVATRSYVTIGLRGYVLHSSDTNVTGGSVTVKVPLTALMP